MFTESCFIRKNTPELRESLEKLGYKSHVPVAGDAICTFMRDNKAEYMNFTIDEDFEVNIKDSFPFIDCGENEDLFLAIAALRDDTDIHQWYTDKSGQWHKCNLNEGWKFIYFHPVLSPVNAHKATVKELIKHFQK